MKKLVVLSIIFAGLSYFSSAQTVMPFKNYAHTSDILPKGHYRYSLLAHAEYGLTKRITISTHPLWMFGVPSVDARWQLRKQNNPAIALYHGISYPSPMLDLVARKGTGGFISPEFDIPFMLSLRNGLISTYNLTPNQRITGEIGVEFALFNGELEPGSSIDLPVISPRNAVYYKNAGLNLALGMEGQMIGKFDYYLKAETFLFPFKDEDYQAEYDNTSSYFAEMTGFVFWNRRKKLKWGLGGKLCYGDYPFGTQWHLLPMFDFVKYVGKWQQQ